MIKSIFLNRKSKAKRAFVEHCTYLEANKIGILYNADEYEDEILNDLIDSIQRDGKAVAKLGFVDKPSEFKLLFCKKDISIAGAIKKESIEFFTQQSFDFLISLNTLENINYKYVLAISNAACKIGFETESYGHLLQMSLRPEEDKLVSVRNVMKYLKMI